MRTTLFLFQHQNDAPIRETRTRSQRIKKTHYIESGVKAEKPSYKDVYKQLQGIGAENMKELKQNGRGIHLFFLSGKNTKIKSCYSTLILLSHA